MYKSVSLILCLAIPFLADFEVLHQNSAAEVNGQKKKPFRICETDATCIKRFAATDEFASKTSHVQY